MKILRLGLGGVGLLVWGVQTFIKLYGGSGAVGAEGGYALPFGILRIVLGVAALYFAYRLYQNEQ